MKARTLSPVVIQQLVAALAEEGAFDWLAHRVCEVIPASRIKANKGFLPYIPAAMSLRNDDDTNGGAIGFTDATVKVPFGLSERPYATERIGFSVEVSKKLVDNDELYAEAERYVFPALANKIGASVDMDLLGEILTGQGQAADSRDVTIHQVDAAERWDTADGKPLDVLEDAVLKIGGPGNARLILSTDRAQLLQRSPQVRDAYHGPQNAGRVGRRDLAAFLSSYLGISEVIIGGQIFQDGDATDAFSAEYQLNRVCFVTKKANLVLVPFGGETPDYRQKYDEDTNVIQNIADIHIDVCTYDPALSMAIVDCASGEDAFDPTTP